MIPSGAAVLITFGNLDPKIDECSLNTLGIARTHTRNKCILFLYDLNDDNKIDVIEYR
jgi:hypothetical protein